MAGHIILQLGLHKTATTSLQTFLLDNQGGLALGGVRYIPLQRMRTDVTPLFWALDRNRREKLAQFITAVDQETVLMSDENIIGTPGELVGGGLYPYARNRIRLFCEEMKDRRITIFLTLREPHRFLTSMYSEFLRHNEFTTFDDYLAGFDIPGFSYRKAFGWLLDLPSNTRVRIVPFEKSNGGGVVEIARTLIVACGPGCSVDPEKFPATKTRSAYSREELDLGAEIARRADPQTTRFFLNLLDHREKRFGDTVFQPLPDALVEKLNARYREDLDFFLAARR